MQVNSNFEAQVALHFEQLKWLPSPMPGVDRKMLDRVGDEVARATSIVRYAPGSAFSEHVHSGGEEFIVLEGTFQDEHADYPAGTYVRNPVGTRHVPRSEAGCTIFVKLWQFDPDDQCHVTLDLGTLTHEPLGSNEEARQIILHRYGDETVFAERWSANAVRSIGNPLGAELLILEGAVIHEGETLGRYDWMRIPCGAKTDLHAGPDGATLWAKTGHLGEVRVP